MNALGSAQTLNPLSPQTFQSALNPQPSVMHGSAHSSLLPVLHVCNPCRVTLNPKTEAQELPARAIASELRDSWCRDMRLGFRGRLESRLVFRTHGLGFRVYSLGFRAWVPWSTCLIGKGSQPTRRRPRAKSGPLFVRANSGSHFLDPLRPSLNFPSRPSARRLGTPFFGPHLLMGNRHTFSYGSK